MSLTALAAALLVRAAYRRTVAGDPRPVEDLREAVDVPDRDREGGS